MIDPGPERRSTSSRSSARRCATACAGCCSRTRIPTTGPRRDRIRKRDRRGGRRVRASPRRPTSSTLDLDLVLADGDTIDGTEFRLEALHTPGPRAEPPVLLPRRGARAVHRRPRAERHDHGRQPAARRRHDRSTSRRSNGCASSSGLARICPGHGDVIEDPTACSTSTSRTASSASARSSAR